MGLSALDDHAALNGKNLLRAESPLCELSGILTLTVICPHFLLISCFAFRLGHKQAK